MLSVLVTSKVFINEFFLAVVKILCVCYDLSGEPCNLSLSALWWLLTCCCSLLLLQSGPWTLVHEHMYMNTLGIHRTQNVTAHQNVTVPALSTGRAIWMAMFNASDEIFCVQSSPSPSLRLQMLSWGGWAAGMCSLLRFFQVSFLHPWFLHDSTAAVQAKVSQRPDVIFYTSGKRVWNPTKWDRQHFMCTWQGSKGQCWSPAPCFWCLVLYSWLVQTAVVIAPAN